jgi:uncharacterized protein YacL
VGNLDWGMIKALSVVVGLAVASMAISIFGADNGGSLSPLYGQIITILVTALLGMIGLTYRGITRQIGELREFMVKERNRMDRFVDVVFELELSHHNDQSKHIMAKFREFIREERKAERADDD